MKRKYIGFLLGICLFAVVSAQNAFTLQEGMASWYGGKFHGRKTANGEIFDTNSLTAAHRTLPFNTRVKVTNLGNGRSVIVRINDRGPFVQGRIIDLSQAAAEKLDMIHTGTARVSIEVVADPKGFTVTPPQTSVQAKEPDPAGKRYTIQVGSFSVAANAERLHIFLVKQGFAPDLEPAPPDVTRVVLHNIPEHKIDTTIARLRASGINDFLIRKVK